jgi:hypothetical protein
MHKLDHTLNRISLVGIGGGLALIAALYYPLYVLLPSQYLAEDFWPRGSSEGSVPFASPLIGGFLLLLALLLVITTGYIASKQAGGTTRRSKLFWGALAGAIAGAIFFYGLGSAAVSVVGNRSILAHGLVPAESESHLVWLLAESVTSTIFWLYSTFWLTLLASMALGAIGGLLTPLAAQRNQEPDWSLAAAIGQAVMLGTLLSLTLSVAVFTFLGPNIEQSTAELQADGFSLSFSPSWLSFWTAATPMVLYLLSLSAFYLLIDKAMKSQEPARMIEARGQAYLGAFVAAHLFSLLFMMLEWFFSVSFNQLFQIIVIMGGAINLMLVILLLRSANASVSRLPTTVLPAPLIRAQWLQRSLQPTVILAFILSLIGLEKIPWLLLIIVAIAFAILWRRSLSFEMRLQDIYSILLPTILAITLPFFVTLMAPLGVVLISVPAIAPLTVSLSDAESLASSVDFTLADKVHNLYLAHPATLLLVFVLSALLVGLSILAVKLRLRRTA